MKPAGSDPVRILIVDDTPANLSLLVDALQAAGYRPLVATSGEIALQRLAQHLPGLILLDMRMPGLDGLQVCARIQAHREWREIPVIFMTAIEEPEQKVAAFAAGAVDYVTKPFHTDEVLARIATHLRLKRLQRELAEELAWRAETERALRASLDRAVVVATRDGEMLFHTHRAGHLMERHLGWSEAAGGALPKPLARLVAAGRSAQETVAGALEARVTAAGDDDLVTILLEERRQAGDFSALRALGLSEREAEVLFWMSEGKSNPEIALILGAATGTIKKHAENIFAKLGVENRAAAMRLALERLR
jgi:DNA-binding response OmpR family regulator/DNA-binding CsgD family transcriptional regulator